MTSGRAIAKRGGRPSQQQAEQIPGKILDAARDLFFTQGYGATSVEAIVGRAQISKRTFYHRFKDKADVFQAVVHHVIGKLRPPDVEGLFEGKSCEALLRQLGVLILRASLTPEALALHRLILAEASRFPELALAANAQGARQEAVQRIAGLLQHEVKAGRLKIDKPAFAAEQFLHMLTAAPQRRALGLGKPMTAPELALWADDTVTLFLHGCHGDPATRNNHP